MKFITNPYFYIPALLIGAGALLFWWINRNSGSVSKETHKCEASGDCPGAAVCFQGECIPEGLPMRNTFNIPRIPTFPGGGGTGIGGGGRSGFTG